MSDLDQSPAEAFFLVARGPTDGFTKDYNPDAGGGGTPGGVSGNVQYNNAGIFGGLTDIQLTTKIQLFTPSASGAVPAAGGGTTGFLRQDGAWASPGAGAGPGGSNGQIEYNNAGSFGGFTASGDAIINTGTGVVTIANLAVTYAKMQNIVNNNRVLGNVAGASQPVAELTGTQVTSLLDTFTASLKGLVPPGTGGVGTFLRVDGAWATPAGGGGGGTPGGASQTIQYNNSGAFDGMSGTSWDDTNRALTRTGATVTSNKPINNDSQTWNFGSTIFTAYKLNITDTLSNANSLFVQYQLNGTDVWDLRKDGTVTTGIWGGTPIAATVGGTGQTTTAIGDTLYGGITINTFSKLPGNITTARLFLRQVGNGVTSAAPAWDTVTPADVGAIAAPSPTVRGGYPTWSNTTGAVIDGQGVINALAYGVLADSAPGSTPAGNKTALQNALNTGKIVYLPTGTYTINGTVTLSTSGGGLIGDGMTGVGGVGGGTILQGNFASGDLIQVSDGVFFTQIRDMLVGRTIQGTTGSGININGSASGTTGCDGTFLHNLNIYNHFVGVTLSGQTTQAHFIKAIISSCASHGVVITGRIMQWQLFDILSEANTGDGFRITGTGPNPNPCGQWRGLSTSGNSGFSFKVTRADGLRVADSFFGGGSLGEVIVQTANASDVPHHFTNVYCECGSAGVNAWQFDASCITEVHLANCTGTVGGAGNGIVSAAPLTMITNGAFIAKAGFGASSGSGILITGARTSIVATTALGFGGAANIFANSITAASIHACRANSSINTVGTTTVSNVGNY